MKIEQNYTFTMMGEDKLQQQKNPATKLDEIKSDCT